MAVGAEAEGQVGEQMLEERGPPLFVREHSALCDQFGAENAPFVQRTCVVLGQVNGPVQLFALRTGASAIVVDIAVVVAVAVSVVFVVAVGITTTATAHPGAGHCFINGAAPVRIRLQQLLEQLFDCYWLVQRYMLATATYRCH